MKRKPVVIDAKKFGAKLREARIKSGKKQSEVAKAVGLAPNSISYHEQGRSIPSLDLAVQLSCYLKQALNNLSFRAKMELKYDRQAKLTLDKNCLKEV